MPMSTVALIDNAKNISANVLYTPIISYIKRQSKIIIK